jgi:hypothetical protein
MYGKPAKPSKPSISAEALLAQLKRTWSLLEQQEEEPSKPPKLSISEEAHVAQLKGIVSSLKQRYGKAVYKEPSKPSSDEAEVAQAEVAQMKGMLSWIEQQHPLLLRRQQGRESFSSRSSVKRSVKGDDDLYIITSSECLECWLLGDMASRLNKNFCSKKTL